MRILVVSDTHGDEERLRDVVSKYRSSLDLVIHLGDNLSDANSVMSDFPTVAFLGVKGNCDFSYVLSDASYEGAFTAEGRRIFYIHGHKYNVNYGIDYLASNAKLRGCDVALFGHTHVRLKEESNGVLVINPGSLSRPRDNCKGSYCLLDINGADINCEIMEVE